MVPYLKMTIDLQDEIIESDRIEYWAESFGVPLQALFNKNDLPKPISITKADKSEKVKRRKRKRRVALDDVIASAINSDDDFPSLLTPKQFKRLSKKGKKRFEKKSETAASANQHRLQVKQELEDLVRLIKSGICQGNLTWGARPSNEKLKKS